jgi:hypothetical protein
MIVTRQTTLSHPRELRDSRRILSRIGPALPVRCKDGGLRKFTGRRRNRLSWRNDRTIVFAVRAKVDEVVAQTSEEDLQSLRKSIDATPEAASALKAKGLNSSHVVAINIADGVLTMFAKTA